MWVIYVLLTVASTCSNMPYGAMNACITPDATDRAKTGGLRMMFANVASMLTLIIAVPLITSLGDGTATSGALLAALNYVANTQQIPQVLNAIDGVSAEVSLEDKAAYLTLSADEADDVLIKAVTDAGYTVTEVL